MKSNRTRRRFWMVDWGWWWSIESLRERTWMKLTCLFHISCTSFLELIYFCCENAVCSVECPIFARWTSKGVEVFSESSTKSTCSSRLQISAYLENVIWYFALEPHWLRTIRQVYKLYLALWLWGIQAWPPTKLCEVYNALWTGYPCRPVRIRSRQMNRGYAFLERWPHLARSKMLLPDTTIEQKRYGPEISVSSYENWV